MKEAIHKSPIPESQLFVVKELDEKHFDPVWHAHSEFQLFVVLEGTGTRFIGDSIKTFSPGELILTGPHLPHLWRSDETYFHKKTKSRAKGIVIYLKENFLGDEVLNKEELMTVRKFLQKSLRGLEFYGARKVEVIHLMKDLTSLKGLESVIQLLKIVYKLSTAKEYRYISHTAYEDPFKESEADRMNKVYEYVIKNFRSKISLQDLAHLVYMTPTSLSRYFRHKNNKTLSQFITEIRIKHACKLLTETEKSISQISQLCGFNTLSNFNKQFKDVMLKKPYEYRKEFLNI